MGASSASLKVMIAGSGTTVPSKARHPSGAVVQVDDSLMLVDSGSGTLSQLARLDIDYRAITTAAYTHSHPDHTLDLAALLQALNFTPSYVHTTDLQILGPVGFQSFVEDLIAVFPSIAPRKYALKVRELADGSAHDMKCGTVRVATVPHGTTPALAYRIEASAGSVVFSGDCSPSQRLVQLATKADMALFDCSFPFSTAESQDHMTAEEAGQMAAQAGVGRLVLTHFYPAADQCDVTRLSARWFSGEILSAEDGMVLTLSKTLGT